jgi:hypothetical protein
VPFRSISAEPIDEVDLSAGNGGEYGSGGGTIGAGNAGVGGLYGACCPRAGTPETAAATTKTGQESLRSFVIGAPLDASILRPASSLG